MTIRTKEDLIDKIALDHVWRIREISELKTLIVSPTLSPQRKKVLCRAGIALLYAHWEGFIKKTGTYFLEYVAMQKLPISALKSNFVTLIIKNKIDEAAKSNKYSAFDKLTDFLINQQSSRAKIPFKQIVNTESNLSTTVLKEITWCLGIDYIYFESKEKLIDLKLVGRRNHVAHGEEMPVDVGDFMEIVEEVLGLMNTFRNLIENSAVLSSYKRAIHTNP
jgi:hypothetical protein